jgi:DNA polymerase I-like protein with 3'-5' exonuclease and polymerase domains
VHVLTDGASPTRATIVGFAIATAPRTAWFVPVGRTGGSLLDPVQDGMPLDESLAGLKPLLERETPRKIGHDLKTAAVVLARHGVTTRGAGPRRDDRELLIGDALRARLKTPRWNIWATRRSPEAWPGAPKRRRWRKCRQTR